MPLAYVALGGNLGDVAETFLRAQSLLDETPGIRVLKVSRRYRTAPVGTESGAAYLNAAMALQTDLPPLGLLDQLQSIESACGRIRTTHWGPRTLDLDLLLYDELVLDHPRLRIPHPACWYRRFVLDPLAEIAGDVMHPGKRLQITALREQLLPRPLPIAVCGTSTARLNHLLEELAPRFPQVRLLATTPQNFTAAANPDAHPAITRPALILCLPTDDEAADSFAAFENLPPLPRLDLTEHGDIPTAIADVLTAALDAPVPQ